MPETLLVTGHTYKLKFKNCPGTMDVYVFETMPGNRTNEALIISEASDYYASRVRFYDKQVEKILAKTKVPADMRKWQQSLACAFFRDERKEIKREIDLLCSWKTSDKEKFALLLQKWSACDKCIQLYLKGPTPGRLASAVKQYRAFCERRALPHQRKLSRSVRRRLRQKETLRNLNNKFSKKPSRTRYSLGGRLVMDLEDMGIIGRSRRKTKRFRVLESVKMVGVPFDLQTSEPVLEESPLPKKKKKKKIPF